MARTKLPKQVSEEEGKIEMVRALRKFAGKLERETNPSNVDTMLDILRLAVDTEIRKRYTTRMRQVLPTMSRQKRLNPDLVDYPARQAARSLLADVGSVQKLAGELIVQSKLLKKAAPYHHGSLLALVGEIKEQVDKVYDQLKTDR